MNFAARKSERLSAAWAYVQPAAPSVLTSIQILKKRIIMKKTNKWFGAAALAALCIIACTTSCKKDKAQENTENTIAQQENVTPVDPYRQANEAFIDSIGKADGVHSLGAGISYRVLTEGHGPKPSAQSTVRVHYEGKLIDGNVFDSSYERKEPAEFPVGGVIEGWQYALKAMPAGSTWEVYIPWYYAYKEAGSGANIPPYSALVFKIELLDVLSNPA